MQLSQPFLKLPIAFDGSALEAEVRALPSSSWVPHPTGYVGNEAVRLVTVGGQPTDAFEGPMRPTPQLEACRYMREVMAELGGVWGRSRLMGLGAGAEVPEHIDVHYHWRTHLRIHIPVITNPAVEFTCGGETVHMAPGECWIFDSFRWHEVHNRGTEQRIHLVLDTVMTDSLWQLIDSAKSGTPSRSLTPGQRAPEPLYFENYNAPTVMSAWEVRNHVAFIVPQMADDPRSAALTRRLERFADGWAGLWARFGDSGDGLDDYRRMIAATRQDLVRLGAGEVEVENGLTLLPVVEQLVFVMAVAAPAQSAEQRLAS